MSNRQNAKCARQIRHWDIERDAEQPPWYMAVANARALGREIFRRMQEDVPNDDAEPIPIKNDPLAGVFSDSALHGAGK